MFRQARWDEPLLSELSHAGKVGFHPFTLTAEEAKAAADISSALPKDLIREGLPDLPEISEVEVLRHYTRLSQQNYGVDLGIYPLGSCTMKYNPKVCDTLASSHKLTELHPYQDESTVQGILQILYELSTMLAEVVGLSKVSLQPSAGAQGEFAGCLIIRAYHKWKGELEARREIIVPDSAHGSNPASASMAGFRVVEVPSDEEGQVDIDALKRAVGPQTAGLMLTNPNTLGIFESRVLEISEIVHDAGGLLYYDGANINAILGKVRPGDMGFDIVHLNLHKTFATPHGGGGPGAGPIAVTDELAKFLPVPTIEFDGSRYYLDYNRPYSIGRVRAFYGNIAVLFRAYVYLLLLGRRGLEKAAETAVLNANYLMRKIERIRGFSVPLYKGGPRKHEFVASALPLTSETGVTAMDVAKRLLDYGMHPPIVYFPLIIKEAMMFEPTETVSKEELDRLVEALERISQEAYTNPQAVKGAPYNTAVGRVDEVKASHPRTLCLTWKMLKSMEGKYA